MKTVIDELSLKIDIKLKKDIDKTISSLANSINKLNKAVSNVSALKKYVNQLNKLSGRNIKITAGSGAVKSKQKLSAEVEKEEISLNKEVSKTDILTSKNIDEKIAKLEQEFFARKELQNATEKAQKQEEKRQEQSKKDLSKSSGLVAKMMRSFGRIALYRAARAVISGIVKSATEGLENIRAVDEELDTSMKKISQSFTGIKNSLTSLLTPLITALEPIITKIADTLAGWANSANEARAAMSGQTTYTKILTSDSKEYKKNLEDAAGTLLEFDKFSALNKNKDTYTGTVAADVTMSKEEAESTLNQFKAIETAALGVGSALAIWTGVSFVKKIGRITDALKDMTEGSTAATKAQDKLKDSTAALATVSILSLITGIVSLIVNWKDMNSTAKVLIPTLSALAGIIVAIVAGLTIAKGNWLKALSIGAIVTGAGLTVGSALSAQKYADGGFPKEGQLFIAREAGAEMVGSMNGRTAVANNDQIVTGITQGVYNAMMAYNTQTRGQNGSGDVYLDGTKVGRVVAKGSHQEMVRVGLIKANS